MITLLHVITDTNIGGAGRSLLSALACRDRARFYVHAALPRGSALTEHIQALDVPVHLLRHGADRSLDLGAVGELKRLVGTLEPDLIHTHGSLSGRLAGRLCGRKVVYTKHCAFPPGPLAASRLGRRMVRTAEGWLSQGVIAIGPSAREALTASGVPENKVHTLYNGVQPLLRCGAEQRQRLRQQYGFGPEDFVLGILARLEPCKGHRVVLDAVEELLNRGRRVKLLIAGTGSLERELRRRAARLPGGTVHFAGFVPRPELALWAMDLQVNASTLSETSSLSLLEGMSLGLPALVSDVGGNPHLICHGETGLVVPPGDPAALADGVERLMDRPEELADMGRRGEARYRQHFTARRFAREVEKVYQTVLREEGARGL